MSGQRNAWLYCTIDDSFFLLGEIEDEGSFERLINSHCAEFGEHHRHCIHVLIENTPEATQVADLLPNLHDLQRFGWDERQDLQRAARRRLGLPARTR